MSEPLRYWIDQGKLAAFLPDMAAIAAGGGQLNREEVARALGKSLPYVDKLIREAGDQFVVDPGGNGVPYQIDARKLSAYLAAKALEEAEEDRKQREAVERMALEFTGEPAEPLPAWACNGPLGWLRERLQRWLSGQTPEQVAAHIARRRAAGLTETGAGASQ